VNFVLFILAYVFWLQQPKEVNVADVQAMDAPYVALLLAAYTSGAMYGPPAAIGTVVPTTGTLAPPTKLTLETLGSTKVLQSVPSGTKHFGLDSTTFMLVGSWMNNPDTMARQFQNLLFTGEQKTGVTMASPMWVYEHNLHLLDPNFCTTTEIAEALVANRANGVNPAVAPVAPAVVPPRVLHCSPAYPTAVDYKGCYNSMKSHKNIFAFYAVVGMFLWIVSSVCYISKASTETGGFGTILVPYVQLVSFVFNTVTLAMLSVAISDGIPALYDKKDVCPNKQTGLLSLYETFFAVYIGIILVLAMHIMEEIRNKWYPYVESAADTTTVDTTAYSCNSHHYSP
jgi:hypothetical protein